jgi:hypothetical protein
MILLRFFREGALVCIFTRDRSKPAAAKRDLHLLLPEPNLVKLHGVHFGWQKKSSAAAQATILL